MITNHRILSQDIALTTLLIYRSIRLTIVIKRSYQIKRKIKDVVDMINITLILPKQTQIYVIHAPHLLIPYCN